jgi:diguanylate cyclase (GGDEF)-like protein/PAS domain S-box-containing protein
LESGSKNSVLNGVRGLLAWIVLGVGLLLSLLTWNVARTHGNQTATEQLDSIVADVRTSIESRINNYADVLSSVRALHQATADRFSGKVFNEYLASLNLAQRYPGVKLILYAQLVNDEQRAQFEAQVRAAGEPNFAIKPDGRRDEYVVVRHFFPREDNEAVLGLDLAGDAVRRDALSRVRDSGQLTATGPLKLVSDPEHYPGFAMRLPLYRPGASTTNAEQRHAALIGVVAASFVVIDVMRGLFSESSLKQVRIRIHDAGPVGETQGRVTSSSDNLMFDSMRLQSGSSSKNVSNAGAAEQLTREISLEVGGRRWNVDVAAHTGFGSAAQRWLSWAVLLSGIAISLLLAGLAHALQTSRARAVAWADRATADLRASEVQLIEEQRRTRELIEVIPNPIFIKGTDGRYIGVNKAWETLFGVSRAVFLGKTVHDLYPDQAEIAAHLHAKDQELWNSGGSQEYEATIKTPQGRTLDTVYYKATYKDGDGHVAGLIGMIVDVTERKANEQRFRALFDNAAVGIVTLDLGGAITDANQKFLSLLGYAKEELVGRCIDDLAVSEGGGNSSRPQKREQTFSKASASESRLVHKDGRGIWVRRTMSAIHGADGSPEYLVNIVEDITDRKQEELRRTMEYAVTRMLAEEESLAELFPKVIKTICHSMGWEFGLAWTWDRDERGLKCCASWGAEAAELREFVADSMRRVIKPMPGEEAGLIRRTYASVRPVWISNVAPAEGFKRAKLIWSAGLHGAFGFPLLRGSEVVGVMEFYQRSVHESEKSLVGTAQSIGRQIGQYMGRREAEEQLKFVAGHDALTKLPNRMMFNQRLEHVVKQAERGGQGLAVMFIDLDRFKIINDTLGHEAGDVVLCEVAKRLTTQLRTSDTVARLGGDEFVVLIENAADPALIGNVAQKLIKALTDGFMLSGEEYHVTASIGISTFPGDGKDAHTLLKNADIAMYRAKDHGGNVFQFYALQMNGPSAPV